MTTDLKSMKDKVKERYGKLADRVNQPDNATLEIISDGYVPAESSCCGPTCCDPDTSSQSSGAAARIWLRVCKRWRWREVGIELQGIQSINGERGIR